MALLKRFDNVLLASMKSANNTLKANTDKINGVLLPNSPTPTSTKTPTPTPTRTYLCPESGVTIGTQIWTVCNLNVTTYSDGTSIPQVTGTTGVNAWSGLTTGAWCYYNNVTITGNTYGKLYNWYAVAGIYDAASASNPSLRKKLAPSGYHIPTESEWITVIESLGTQSGVPTIYQFAGGKMKLSGTTYWNAPNPILTPYSGFRALPGGYRSNLGTFSSIRTNGYWWTSSEYDLTTAYYITINSSSTDAFAGGVGASYNWGLSVRLIQDLPATPTPTPTITQTNTQTPTLTPTPSSNPAIPTCGVLFNDNNGNVFYYNVTANTSTQLTVPNFPIGPGMSHTSNKLWGSSDNTSSFKEYNISLTSFVTTFSRDIPWPSGYYQSNGLASISDTVILAVNANTTPNKVVEIDVSGAAVMTTKFSLMLNREITGDFYKTTTNKFLALTRDISGSNRYLTQWDYLTGTLEVDTQLFIPPLDTLDTWGLFQYNNNIYVSSTTTDVSPVSKTYVVNLNYPYTLSYSRNVGKLIVDTSQIPSCLTQNLVSNVATLRVNNNAGNSTYYVNTKTIELPLVSNGTYNFVANWGDGTTSTITNYSQRFHTYTTSSLLWAYDITLTGQVDGFSYRALSTDQKKLLDRIYNWGAIKFINNVSPGNSDALFMGCVNLTMDTCVNAPNLGTVTSLDNCFDGCTKLGKVGGLEYWNVSNIIGMYRMFALTSPILGSVNTPAPLPQDLSSWNTSNVTYMDEMYMSSRLNHNVGNWNVTGVTDMTYMFYEATNFNNGGSDSIKNWNTSSVVYVASMFYSATTFNQPLTNFNFTKVSGTTYMFQYCYEFNQDCSNWERVGSTMQWITDTFFMFGSCRKFNGSVNTWNLQRLSNSQGMFARCYLFNQPMNNWNTSKISTADSMFSNCFSLNQNLSSWNLSSLTQAQASFWSLSTGDANRPRNTFDLTPANLTSTLLGWATNINTVSNYSYISFPSSSDSGTCSGLTQMKAKGWRISWVNTAGGITVSSC